MRRPPAAVLLGALLLGAGCAGPGIGADLSTTEPGPSGVSSVTTASSTTASPTAASSTTASSTTTTTTTTAAPPPTVASSTSTTTTAPATTTTGCAPGAPCGETGGAAVLAEATSGGSHGFVVLRAGGEQIAALEPDHGFYPASSIKALQHVHAVRWVMSQPDPGAALETPIPVYEDVCAGTGPYREEALRDVLQAMMIDSDNARASALQDFFGLEEIDATAALLGMEDTLLAHRFGCGGPANDPANRSTAADLAGLYDRIGSGFLDPSGTAMLLSFMRSDGRSGLVAAAVEEAGALALPDEVVDAFTGALDVHTKAGWWENRLSVAGLVRLPTSPCGDGSPTSYAIAVYIDDADTVAPGFDVVDVIPVLLRGEVRIALEQFAATTPSGCKP